MRTQLTLAASQASNAVPRAVSLLLLAMMAAGTGGCAKSKPSSGPIPAAERAAAEELRTTAGRVPALEQRVSTLQIQLLEKDAQIEDLEDKLDQAIREVVRTMAKLQSSARRAEAASARAEAEIALQALKRRSGKAAATEIGQTERLLAMSTTEFERQNYSGALYLASQARGIARAGAGQRSGATGSPSRPGEVAFALPLQLQTTSRSNVRAGPGMGEKVLFTVEQGAQLVGYSFAGEWVSVRDDTDRRGWIFHTLVDSRRD